MIHVVVGKLGSGKGILVVKRIIEELQRGHRDVVTNVPLRLGPWCNGQHQAQMGLLAYLEREYGETFDAEHRVKVVEDRDQVPLMFLWRRDPETHEWFELPVHREGSVPVSFDAEPIKARGCAPLLCVSDEAWEYYPARGLGGKFGQVPPVIDFYGRQQRKLRDEWYVVTQHHDDLYMTFARISQDFTVCRNHGMERMSFFQQPNVLRTETYLQQPRGAAKVFHSSIYRVDRKGLAQTYDTSAGVGVMGGFAADHGERRKGIPFPVLIVLLVLFLTGLCFLPSAMGKIAGRLIASYTTPIVKHPVDPRPAPAKPAAVADTNGPASSAELRRVSNTASITNQVLVTGYYALRPDRPVLFLSDGSRLPAWGGEVLDVGPGWWLTKSRGRLRGAPGL